MCSSWGSSEHRCCRFSGFRSTGAGHTAIYTVLSQPWEALDKKPHFAALHTCSVFCNCFFYSTLALSREKEDIKKYDLGDHSIYNRSLRCICLTHVVQFSLFAVMQQLRTDLQPYCLCFFFFVPTAHMSYIWSLISWEAAHSGWTGHWFHTV